MASVLKVDKLDPQSGTALEIGTSGDTITVPSGATLDISASTLTPPATMPASSAANLTNIPGANITGTIAAVSGANLTSLNATNLGSGTVPTARLGSGTASSSTVLYGDQTYKAEPGGGKVLQVVQGSASSGTQTTTSNSWQTYANVTCTITPAATSSKILLWASQFNANGGNYVFMDFRREISGGASTDNISGATYGISWHQDSANVEQSQMMTYLDSPSTTSAITYKMNFRNDNNSDTIQLGQSLFQVIIAMEIGA